MTEESAVKVCVRVRPLIQREEASAENAEPVPLYWKADKQAVHQIDDGNVTKSFSFDRVFSAEESTNQLYQDIAKPLVVSAVEGYNGTIFAYGQTSSGKTFTMMGCSGIPGVIPLAMEDVFQTIKNCPKKEFLLRVSYMEIYNETVTDLLCESWKRKPLEIREGNYKNVYVADLTEELVTSAEQALSWIRKGEKNRHYGKTKMNQRSSRSHAIFRMILESRESSDPASGENADGAIIVSHLNLVDLAGAERASQTGAEGARLKEGCNINRSLFTLGQVIKKLSDDNQGGFTNYRDSKLTRILQNSLGGNAKTVIICNITPATVEETLSTLQFASAAKRMKNDPHVTEVSDDGALLRRYRNEIVDLKRRLQEVSSVTQTTATEKEVLAQLLQEKDQLQREQQDRIKNLTKIIVTSSNFVAFEKKIPKRRVTWGGKLLKPVQSGDFHLGDAEFGPSEPFVKKRKTDLSVLVEQDDDGGEFDSQWEIPEDVPYDIEMNQSNVTMRSVSYSDPSSPGRLSELCDKVSGLELQLHMEMQQKQEAVETSTSLQNRLAELEKQLEAREQEPLKDPQEEYTKDLGETIQLCETLVSEKEIITAERDLIKQELSILKDEKQVLSRDNENLRKEIEEKRMLQEFSTLEHESIKQSEVELLAEISNLKKAAEQSVVCIQKLEADMDAMSTLLKQKEALMTELQNLNGKDLVQENQQLKQSLSDAEALSRETKKDWAFLRSDNLSLKERDSSITIDCEKMTNKMTVLSSKLEVEKSRFKTMQADLQKELHCAFEENTKLSILLDGKVPKNLIDSIELERTVTGLKKELEKHQEQEGLLQMKVEEQEGLLQTKVEELEALKDLSVQVESLKKQAEKSREHANAIEEKLCEQQRLVQDLEKKLVDNQESSEHAEEHFRETSQQHQDQVKQLSEELQLVRSERDALQSERTNTAHISEEEREKLSSHVVSLTEERDQLQEILEGVREERGQLKRDLQEKEEVVVQVQEELRQHMNSGTECQALQEPEKAELQQQIQKLVEELEGVSEERTKLQSDLQENMEMATETKKLLDSIQEELKQQQQLNADLKTQSSEMETHQEQIKQLSEELRLARSEGDALQSEITDTAQRPAEELEKLHSHVTSLTEERDQLQEILEEVREARSRLERDLQEKEEMIIENQEELRAAEDLIRAQQDSIQHLETQVAQTESVNTVGVLCDKNLPNTDDRQNEGAGTENLLHSIQEEFKQQQQLNADLKAQSSEMETRLEQQIKQLSEELQLVRSERDALQSERTNTGHISEEDQEKLRSRVKSLTEERDQLQETLDGVREERCQLKRDLQEKEEMVVQVHEELRQQRHLTSEHQALGEVEQTELQQKILQLGEDLEGVREERSQLRSDMQENVEMMIENQEELRSAQEKIGKQQEVVQDLKTQILQLESKLVNVNGGEENLPILEDLQDQIKKLSEELQLVRSERDALHSERTNTAHISEEEREKLRSHVTSLTEERDQLQEILEGVREERSQLKRDLEEKEEMVAQVHEELRQQRHLTSEHQALREIEQAELQQKLGESDMQENVEMVIESHEELRAAQEKIGKQREVIQDLKTQILQLESKLVNANGGEENLPNLDDLPDQLKQLSEELQLVRSERDALQSERTNTAHISEEEQEKLHSRVTALTEERDQLQEILDGVREERCQLKRDLQEKEEMVAQVHEELRQQQHLTSEHQALREIEQAELQQKILQLGEELEGVREERSQLRSDMQENVEMMIENQEELRSAQEKIGKQQEVVQDLKTQILQLESKLVNVNGGEENLPILEDLQDQIKQLSEELQLVRSERDALQSERTNTARISEEEREKLCSHVASLTEERDQLQETLEGVREERSQLKRDLEEKAEMTVERRAELLSVQEELKLQQQLNSDLQAHISEKESQLQQQIKQLSEELQLVHSARDALHSEGPNTAHISEEEREKLRSHVTSLTEERDQLQEILEGVREERSQLKRDLEEKEEMTVERRAELLSVQEELNLQQQLNSDLQAQISEKESQLQQQINQLSEELQLVRSERDALHSEGTNTAHISEEEREKLRSHVTSLTEERDQLQEILEGVREERSQLKRDLEEKEEMTVERRAELLSVQEELKLQQQLNSDLQAQISEKESQLQQQINQLSEELQLVRSERDVLHSEGTNTPHISEEEREKLRSHVTSLTEERDQLREILEGVREERSQLKRDLEEKEEMTVERRAELLSVQEELKLQQQLNSDLQAQISEKESQLQQQMKQLSEELQLVRSERDALQSERTNTAHISEEEREKLHSHVASLTEERDQLQEILEGVREERSQLKRDLEEKEEMTVERRAELLSVQEELKLQQQLNSDLQAQISEKESQLQQQVAQVQEELRQQQHLNSEHEALREREQAELHQQIQLLVEELEGVREERTKLKSDLQENMDMATETQNLLDSIQEELKQQQQLNADLKTQSSEMEARLEQQMKQLSEELQLVRSERDALQSERTNTGHISEEEQEKLRSHVTSLTEERDRLQETLEGVREERGRLKRDLQEKEEMAAQVQRTLNEQERLNSEQQTVKENEQAEFQQQIQQLAEELEGVKKNCELKAALEEASQESLSEANAAISSLREQIRDLEERSSPAGEGGERLRCRLEESQLQLQKVLEKCQQFSDNAVGASKSLEQPMKDASLVQNELAFQIMATIPKPLRALYVEFRKSTDGINDLLWRLARASAQIAKLHRQQLEAHASQDAACFAESRLQDLLIRTAQCPGDGLAVTSDDFHQVWDQRLSELLERREQKLPETSRILAELEEGMARNAATVSEELPEQERTNEELRALIAAPSLDLVALENLLERERARRTLVLQNKKAVFLNLQNEYFKMDRDLKAFKTQASQQLKEERSRSLTLLQKRESGPAKSEADLLQSIQELGLKLRQSETHVQVVQTRGKELEKELEEAQERAEDRVSKHKEATQLLQTELQDTCAQVKERDDSIQSLEEKLRESQAQVKRGMAPSAVELEEMKNKLIKMELEKTARASTHQEQLEKMRFMLDHKEEALRKLKEALRHAQQQDDESFTEETVHAKATATTGGRTVQSTVIVEKNRLEEEVKQLKKKMAQLESLTSSQQLEITKWKTRATKLKENKRVGMKMEAPLSPHTPTKRQRPITSEGHVLDSPKSKFFDANSVSESMSANCPKQFFDNSSLGNVPEVLYPPTVPALGSPESAEIDLNAAVEDKKAEWWPMSPTQSENCKTQ
ncbi:hypothetical protein SKAU_G00007230 [Synaphobranchus kaupii]|uniref:Centromere-associated protein E n=1 Tax=Synaphobranchus kaupii TaxID=118154 RepID=A0A9Q1GAD5_SYNKA|nr:hypothetical protein SKAU_G00007230 [Synaphobranchus kaupii]